MTEPQNLIAMRELVDEILAERPTTGIIIVFDGDLTREIDRYDLRDLPPRKVCENTFKALAKMAPLTDEDLARPGKMPLRFRRMKDWEMSRGNRR